MWHLIRTHHPARVCRAGSCPCSTGAKPVWPRPGGGPLTTLPVCRPTGISRDGAPSPNVNAGAEMPPSAPRTNLHGRAERI